MTRRLTLSILLVICALVPAGAVRASAPQPAYADEAFARVNTERGRAGRAALARLRSVELAAQLHAMDMANREYMDHATAAAPSPVFPDPAGFPAISFTGGMSAAGRLRASGYAFSANGWGENVAYNWGYGSGSPQVAVDGWMNSTGHRDNILNGNFRGAGMGAALSASGKVYYCQVFVVYTAGQPLISGNAALWPAPVPTDRTAPAGWRGLSPVSARTLTPTCSIMVTDTGSGLDVASAGYRFSRDGGVTWSAWTRAACSGTPGTTVEQQITASAVPFNQESRQNRIQFRIADRAGNWGYSPASFITTDRTAPGPWANPAPTRTTDLTPDCTVQVSDAMSGLQVGSAQYRYSVDGGVTWSGWAGAACTGSNGATTVQTVRASGVPFNSAHASRNRLQFRISDAAGNSGVSGAYTINTTP
jgi:uncharacterized protein YkwD